MGYYFQNLTPTTALFLRRVISIRWRNAYAHPIISPPTTFIFAMISTLVPMDITLSITFSSLTQHSASPLCTLSILLIPFDRDQPPVFPWTALRPVIKHRHSSCTSDFYSASAQIVYSSRRTRSYHFLRVLDLYSIVQGSRSYCHSLPPRHTWLRDCHSFGI